MKMAESSENKKKTLLEKEILLLQAISPFPVVFSEDLYYRHIKTRACVGKGYGKDACPFCLLYRSRLVGWLYWGLMPL